MNLPLRIVAIGALIAGIFAGDSPAQKTEEEINTFVAMFTMPKPGKCLPCDRMKPVVKRLDASGFPITIIDNRKLAAALGIKIYPTFVGVVNGKIAKVQVGTCSAKKLMALLPKKFHVELIPDKGLDTVLRAGNPGAVQSETQKIFIFNRPRYWFQKRDR